MVIQKQNKKPRYRRGLSILLIWLLVLVLVIRFGILIQKEHNIVLSLTSQIQSEGLQMQKSRVKLKRREESVNNTWLQNSTWVVSNTWQWE